MASRVLCRIQRLNAQLLLVRASLRPEPNSGFASFSRHASNSSKLLPSQMYLLRPYHRETTTQRFGFSSSASPRATEKGTNQSSDDESTSKKVPRPSQETCEAGVVSGSTETNGDSAAPEQSSSSDSDTEPELSADELVRLVAERDNLLNAKQMEIEKLQDKVLRTYADMENVLERTKREVENSKKYGIQNFAKSLLDVADNLGRASNAVKENFSKVDQSSDSLGVSLLKSLLEGVEMTEKQLAEVFRKFVIEKYDPLNEKFDPNRHNAVFEIPDSSKSPGTIAAVLKPGYMLHDRVLRPAEVGVTKSPPDEK
ncbi:hypothetical protein KSP40_PGU015220 [Platanthera guangdongensis]|uniref:GrpE protein homolog n=1 Tax=Platanthera guangdongensis TaxID=2320717 RepID=A0ABR2MDG6_9ASPA